MKNIKTFLLLLLRPIISFLLGGRSSARLKEESQRLPLRVPAATKGVVRDSRTGRMFDLFCLVLDSGAPYHGDGVFVCESEEHRSDIIARVERTGHDAFPVPMPRKRRRMTDRELHIVASSMDFDRRRML